MAVSTPTPKPTSRARASAPRARRARVPVSDAEYERITAAFWAAREPGADVFISVQRKNCLVRFVMLRPNEKPVTLREGDFPKGI